MQNRLLSVSILLAILTSSSFAQNTTTITTVNPSPRGKYDKLVTKTFILGKSSNQKFDIQISNKLDCSDLTSFEDGQLVQDYGGHLRFCNVNKTTVNDPPITLETEPNFWETLPNNDVVLKDSTKSFGFKYDSGKFIGFKRNINSGSLDLIYNNGTSGSANISMFSIEPNNNGVMLPNEQSLIMERGSIILDRGSFWTGDYPITFGNEGGIVNIGEAHSKKIALSINGGFKGFGYSNSGLDFHTNSTDGLPEMLLNNDGNLGLGLGSSSPDKKLVVKGGDIAIKNGTSNAIVLSEAGSIDLTNSNSQTVTLAINADKLQSTKGIIAQTGDIEASGGNVKATGNVEAQGGLLLGRHKLPTNCGNPCEPGVLWLEN